MKFDFEPNTFYRVNYRMCFVPQIQNLKKSTMDKRKSQNNPEKTIPTRTNRTKQHFCEIES